jgi:uncharacterized protein
MKRFLLALLLVPTFAFAYTSPGKPAGFVNDFAHILKPETVAALDQTLTDFEKTSGDEISVVTIPSLGDETIETYAEKLFQEWGIGKAKEDNGLLLLIAPAEHEMRIEVGYGLEPYVTDIASGRIIRETLTPAFQAGDFDGGVTQAIEQVKGLLQGQALPEESSSSPTIDWTQYVAPIAFFFIYFSSLLARSKSWWAGGVAGAVVGYFFLPGLSIFVCIVVGLIFDFIVSKMYQKHKLAGTTPPWWMGGGGMGGRGGGGFGGFGGGSSGGGGASGRW